MNLLVEYWLKIRKCIVLQITTHGYISSLALCTKQTTILIHSLNQRKIFKKEMRIFSTIQKTFALLCIKLRIFLSSSLQIRGKISVVLYKKELRIISTIQNYFCFTLYKTENISELFSTSQRKILSARTKDKRLNSFHRQGN